MPNSASCKNCPHSHRLLEGSQQQLKRTTEDINKLNQRIQALEGGELVWRRIHKISAQLKESDAQLKKSDAQLKKSDQRFEDVRETIISVLSRVLFEQRLMAMSVLTDVFADFGNPQVAERVILKRGLPVEPHPEEPQEKKLKMENLDD
jgi:septal ring factor EnvC (AmiA/AmiB activator)